jgi:hypothetical protein
MRQAIVDLHAEYPEHHVDEILEHDALVFGEFARREQGLSGDRDAACGIGAHFPLGDQLLRETVDYHFHALQVCCAIFFLLEFVQVRAKGGPGEVPGVELPVAPRETCHKLADLAQDPSIGIKGVLFRAPIAFYDPFVFRLPHTDAVM